VNKNVKTRYKENSCWHSWCCSLLLIWPVGGALGFAISTYALVRIVAGVKELDTQLSKIDIDLGAVVTITDFLVLAVTWTNALVVVNGFREKIRTRFNILGHLQSCIFCFVKFLGKGVVNGSCAVSVVLGCVMVVLMEGVYIILVCTDNLCRGTQEGVTTVLEVIPGYKGSTDPLDEICETIEDTRTGAFNVWFGCMSLVVGQFLVSLYWMKYSTLAMAAPFYQDVMVLHKAKGGKSKVHPDSDGSKNAGDLEGGTLIMPTADGDGSEQGKLTGNGDTAAVPVAETIKNAALIIQADVAESAGDTTLARGTTKTIPGDDGEETKAADGATLTEDTTKAPPPPTNDESGEKIVVVRRESSGIKDMVDSIFA